MTDITALAQSLKAAAENAGADYWQAKKISGDFYVIRKGSYKRECGYTTYQPIAEIDHKPTRDYVAMANPTNILALVEALEKAQQYAKERDEENQDLMLTIGRFRVEREGLEAIRAAAEKLVRCKGRYHSEQNYRSLAALFGVTTPDLPPLEHENVHYADAAEMEIAALRQRIAELESRTVKLPKLKMLEDYLAEVAIEERKQILVGVKLEFHRACVAAGIKVEAE
ncbi:ead/Ea22-like family protein [Klebsiella pneumoniae]|uniref:ead/Ea22-like family protein n=1 Tax=Klebsiella pneumoniae TaxID=573 RepID=UPI002AA5E130|nr:ead/Ea22-like family protein [Klebsiella pneumoniae]MDY7118309.1 ead/Ea22-like family protein [Klebsiella pneumoniae]MDY7671660.1 ead/Ea22-like family protein [Klebsiella pneumoniae]MDY7768958.1 ead/Ea22-like family protein [Klebsiella pneumoniae]